MRNEGHDLASGNRLNSPVEAMASSHILLNRPIAAVRLAATSSDTTEKGTFRQLEPGTEIELCGNGSNAEMVKVQGSDGAFYVVFAEDLL